MRDVGRVPERLEGRPQHGVVEGPVADRAGDHLTLPERRICTASEVPPISALRACANEAPGAARFLLGHLADVEPRDQQHEPDHERGDGGRHRGQPQRLLRARRRPSAISVPTTTTATKFTELLIRKKATERRAMRSAGMPPSCRIHAPSARPARAAGGHDRSHRERRPRDLAARAPRHVAAEDRPEHQHVGDAGQQLEHHRQRDPGRVRAGELVAHLAEARREDDDQDRPPRATAMTCSVRRASRRRSNSRGIVTGARPGHGPCAERWALRCAHLRA